MSPYHVTYRLELLAKSTVLSDYPWAAELMAWETALRTLVPETDITRMLAQRNVTVLAASPIAIVETLATNERQHP